MARETWRPPRKRCGARKRDGSPCPTWAMPNGRCRMHGGKSPGRPIVHGLLSSNPIVRNLAELANLTDEQKVSLWLHGPTPLIIPCSPANPMNGPHGADSLPKIEPLPGAVVEQFRTIKGKRYGPYYFRVYSLGNGRNRRQVKEYVRPERVDEVRAACARWKSLDTMPEWIKRAARDMKRTMRLEQLGETAGYLLPRRPVDHC